MKRWPISSARGASSGTGPNMPESPTVGTQAAELLAELRGLIDKGGQFILEQAPPLAREIVAFGRVYHAIQIAAAAALLISCVLYWKRTFGADWDFVTKGPTRHDWDSLPIGGLAVAVRIAARIMGTGAGSIWLLCQIRPAVLAWCAPRLFILEYILERVKGAGGS